MVHRILIGFGWLLIVSATSLMAQDAGEPPQILTTDLAAESLAEEEEVTVNFVIVDSDQVTKVVINGEEEKITPGDTVLVTKVFRFKPGITTVRIEAEDEKGNKRNRSYRVSYQVPFEPKGKGGGWNLSTNVEVSYEVDDNPTNDLSLPIAIGGIGDVEGQVSDSEQTDTRTGVGLLLAMDAGAFNGFAGYYQTTYSKEINENLNPTIMFLGGQYRFAGKGKPGMQLTFALTDINLGSNDFSQVVMLTPAYEIREVGEDGSWSKTYGLEMNQKSYSDTTRSSASQMTLKRDSKYFSKGGVYSSQGITSLGTNSDGTEESVYNFIGYKALWYLNWKSGWFVHPTAGIQARTYANDEDVLTQEYGPTRLDFPYEFTLGAGKKILKSLQAMFQFQYQADISNDSPYVRQIYGINIRGSF